jgi:hypothetical protein
MAVYGRQHTWGAVVGAALVGGAVCGTLAWYGRLGLSAACAAALIVWIAHRVIDVMPASRRARPGPTSWSPYDRRRSGRAPTGTRLWRRLRSRRRAESPVLDRHATWKRRAVAPPPDPARHPRERGAR